ncbi:RNA polymerase sigma factor [Flexivirga sp. B27]
MRGREHQDEQLEEFIAARTQDLHHDAFQLMGTQDAAEQLVVRVLTDMRREDVDLAQAGADARLRMARLAVRDDTPTEITDVSQLPDEFRALAQLSPRQRAILLLQVVDGLDERETARALQISGRSTDATLRSIPYDELPGMSPHSGELRSLLDAFGDLATTPSATTTLADLRDVPPPPRRPWWTYVAAFLVLALTVTTVVFSQQRHKDWLRTPDGLNHEHGTHFPAYTQGYKLVDIREVEPGPSAEFSVDSTSAVAMNCNVLGPGLGMTVSSDLTSGNYFRRRTQCKRKDKLTPLTPVSGDTLVSVNDFSRKHWPVAVYQQVPLSEYPVATGHFDVQTGTTLDDLRVLDSMDGVQLRPRVKGKVLTLRGGAEHPNGTFKGTLQLPRGDGNLNVVGLLSPTTTGRYLVRADHRVPWTTCGNRRTVSYGELQQSTGCALVDRHIPQIEFQQVGTPQTNARTMPVEITVKDARGPWTLQVVADRYADDEPAEHGPTSVQTN